MLVFTLFHYPVAYSIYLMFKKKLNLYDLVFGAFMVDLEIPVLIMLNMQTDRLVLHSIFGAILLSVPIAYALYPITHKISKTLGIFSKSRPESKISLAIGALSHSLLDSLNHDSNPLLFPFAGDPYIGLVLFGDLRLANIVMNALMGSITLILFMVALYQTNSLSDALSKMLSGEK